MGCCDRGQMLPLGHSIATQLLHTPQAPESNDNPGCQPWVSGEVSKFLHEAIIDIEQTLVFTPHGAQRLKTGGGSIEKSTEIIEYPSYVCRFPPSEPYLTPVAYAVNCNRLTVSDGKGGEPAFMPQPPGRHLRPCRDFSGCLPQLDRPLRRLGDRRKLRTTRQQSRRDREAPALTVDSIGDFVQLDEGIRQRQPKLPALFHQHITARRRRQIGAEG